MVYSGRRHPGNGIRRSHGFPTFPTLGWLIAGVVAAGLSTALGAEPDDLFEGFRPGWRQAWELKTYLAKPTIYTVVEDEGRPALHAVSTETHAGLMRRVHVA